MESGRVPGYAKVVIVGGGIIGCSIAYHLTKIGVTDIVLIERKKLTSGTTWHAAGLVFDLRPSRKLTELGCYAGELYRTIEQETGQSTGFAQKGRYVLALNEGRLEYLENTVSHAGNMNLPANMVPVEELSERWPLLNPEGVIGAAYLPTTSQVNPVDATQALAKGARAGGARIFENTKVTKILTKAGRVSGVETEGGAIEADIVVLACGMWTRELAATIGVNVPLHAAEHFYIVTEPIPGLAPDTPFLGCPDERAYYKEDAGKLLVGAFESDGKAWGTEGIPERFEFDSLPFDLDHFSPFLEALTNRIPILATTSVRTFFTGPESFTPDGQMLLGEAPELRNLFVAAGMCSQGIMWAPGIGKVMAQWIRDRSPPFGLSTLDLRRMMPFQGTRKYTHDRIAESVGLNMDIPWPGRQKQAARGVRRYPLHRDLLKAGAEMGERCGWEVPLYYASADRKIKARLKMGRQDWYPLVREECLATRDAVALYDQSIFAKILVQGPDACRALNWISSADLDVPSGRIVYTAWLNERGGIEADLTINRLAEDRFLILTYPTGQIRDADWLRRHMPSEARASVTDVTSAYGMLSLQGPDSRALLQTLSDSDLSNAALPFGHSREIDCGYVKIRATRLTYVGELGFELLIPTEMTAYVYEQIIEAGKAYNLRHAGLYALGACRLESGYRHLGHDITEDETPLEGGIGFTVAWDKPGGFLGRDALLRQRQSGALKDRLVQVRLADASESAPILEHNEPIWRNGKRVGAITSGGWGFRVEASLGMGYVSHAEGVTAEWLRAGTYEVEAALKKYPAIVQLKRFYDPGGSRTRM